jgi:hypothetical protein
MSHLSVSFSGEGGGMEWNQVHCWGYCWPIVPAPHDDECGAVSRGNQSIQRKPAPMPLYPPQIPHDLTQAAAVESQWLTAWAMAWQFHCLVICLSISVHFLNAFTVTEFWRNLLWVLLLNSISKLYFWSMSVPSSAKVKNGVLPPLPYICLCTAQVYFYL